MQYVWHVMDLWLFDSSQNSEKHPLSNTHWRLSVAEINKYRLSIQIWQVTGLLLAYQVEVFIYFTDFQTKVK